MTGVQTCALPIYLKLEFPRSSGAIGEGSLPYAFVFELNLLGFHDVAWLPKCAMPPTRAMVLRYNICWHSCVHTVYLVVSAQLLEQMLQVGSALVEYTC